MKQVQALTAMLDDHRELYDAALQERRDAWRRRGVTVTYGMQSAQLKDIRNLVPEQARWSFSSQQATLRRLNLAMQAFFRRVKAGQKPGYPRFRGAGWFDTVVWPSDGDGCRWTSTPETKAATRVYVQGVGHVRVQQHRPVAGRVKTISIKREGIAWQVIVSCDDVPANPLPPTGRATGIDVCVVVNARNSSRTCHECRHIDAASRDGIVFSCTNCGHEDHADVNAARNHLRAGLALVQGNHPGGSPQH